MSEPTVDVGVDPLYKHASKPLESIEFDRDFGGYVTVIEHSVPHKAHRPLSSYERTILHKQTLGYPGTLLFDGISNERNSNEGRRRARYYPKNGDATVLPEKTDREADRSPLAQFADTARTVHSYVPRGAALPTLPTSTIAAQQTLYSPEYDRLSLTTADSFQSREDLETDPDTGLMTRVVRDVVFVLPTGTEQLAGRGVTYREVASGVWIRETRTALASDGTDVDPGSAAAFYTREWTTVEEHRMPGYMYAFELSGINQVFTSNFNTAQRRTVILFKPPVRLPFTALAEVQYIETFHAAQPAFPSGRTSFAGKNWIHDGSLVNINFQNILQDSTTNFLSTHPGDSYHGALTEIVQTNETLPTSAFEYRNNIIGSFRLVDVSIAPYKNKTFRMLQKRVKMQGNVTPQLPDVGGIL